MTKPPAVVWVSEETPDRSLGGGHIRAAHTLTALARRVPTALILAGHLEDDETRDALVSVTEVDAPRPVIRNKTEERMTSLRQALGHGPAEVWVTRWVRRALQPLVQPIVGSAPIVILSHQALMPLLSPQRAGFWITDIQHVTSEMARQSRSSVAGRRQRWLVDREIAQAERLERWAVDNFDGVSVCSYEDAELLRVPPSKRVVAFNGVDVDQYRAEPLPSAPRLLLPASLNYLPNVDGATWFCENVWGKVLAACPDARLDLVGRDPVPQVLALADRPGVAVQANVPSMAPWMAQARVVVVPLRIGTGSRLKAAEALASGRPVVGTTVGLEGLGLVDGKHARFADDPETMAAAIVGLLGDDAAAATMAAAGRSYAEQHLRWDRITAKYAEDLLALADASGRITR